MADLHPEARKVAVDALYEARNDGKVMDEAAGAVAAAVLVWAAGKVEAGPISAIPPSIISALLREYAGAEE